jgi:hypothetical protein
MYISSKDHYNCTWLVLPAMTTMMMAFWNRQPIQDMQAGTSNLAQQQPTTLIAGSQPHLPSIIDVNT